MKHCLLLLTLIISLCSSAQDTKLIKLKQQKISYKPEHFSISTVRDDRSDTTSIGTMRAGLTNKVVRINLKDGAAASIDQYLRKNLKQTDSAPSVELHIVSLDISEKLVGMKEQADLSMSVAFYSNGNELISYKGSGYMQTGLDASMYIEQLIRQNLERSLKEFDEWCEINRDGNSGKPGIKVDLVFTKTSNDTDEIIYSRKPLTWDDFKGAPDKMSLGGAATYSGIGMKYASRMKDGKMEVTVTLSAFFDRSRSWYKPSGKSIMGLRHEQKHFDITAIVACELADAIKNTRFLVENYTTELEAMQKKYVKILEDRQQQYDDETAHSANEQAQLSWEQKLDKSVAEMKCY